MSDKPEQTTKSEDTVVSPNGDTTAERYRKVSEREAKLTEAERIKKLREAVDLFDLVDSPSAKKED